MKRLEGLGMGLATVCVTAAAIAEPPNASPAVGTSAVEPIAPAVAVPSAPASTAAAPVAPVVVWSPPAEPDRSGEGSLHDAPLFEASGLPRRFSVTYNPLTLFLVRAELSAEVMVSDSGDHHAINGSFYYGSTTTNSDSYGNVFRGFGGEIGYRYYWGTGGPRGLYLAPSFLIASYSAVPAHGAQVPYANLGGALDLGYQALLADRWVVGLGGDSNTRSRR